MITSRYIISKYILNGFFLIINKRILLSPIGFKIPYNYNNDNKDKRLIRFKNKLQSDNMRAGIRYPIP